MKKALVSLLLLPSVLMTANAQFDKKFTLDVGLGYSIPAPIVDQITSGDGLRPDRLPYVYQNMGDGLSALAQLQYNLSTKFSVGVRADFTRHYTWTDPRTDNSADSFFNVFNLMPFVKYRIVNGKISPYLMVGTGFGFFNGERGSVDVVLENFFPTDPESFLTSIDEVVIREPVLDINGEVRLALLGGVGAEYEISESLGLFVQGTFQTINTVNNETLRQRISYPMFSAGVNLSFIKSKTL